MPGRLSVGGLMLLLLLLALLASALARGRVAAEVNDTIAVLVIAVPLAVALVRRARLPPRTVSQRA